MSDSSEEKASIPAWQKATTAGAEATIPQEQSTSNHRSSSSSRLGLIDQARHFLEDDSIRDASRERKVAFLEKKGLQGDEIQKLITPAPGSTTTPSPGQSDLKTVHDSNTSPSSTASTLPLTPAASRNTSTTASQPSRDIPPIITYPEFLLRPSKPPPLITAQRLTYALYTLASLSALTYGASKFLVQPMLESLSSARHELSATTLQNLERLNEKLETNVSHVPFTMTSSMLQKQHRDRSEARGDDNASEAETVDSDPTELFHRDIATQTSPNLTRTPSITSSNSSSSQQQRKNKDLTSTQSSRLSQIHTNLTSILESQTSTEETTSSLKDTMADFQTYLDNLQFSNNTFKDYSYSHGTAEDGSRNKSKKGREEEEDEATKFKAEIRAVKGALLSSRTFPAARSVTGGAAGLRVR